MKIALLVLVGMFLPATLQDGTPSKPPAAGARPGGDRAAKAPTVTQTPNTLSDKERAEGWVLLFDGTDPSKHLRGYRKETFPEGWKAVDGTLRRVGAAGDIVTKKAYRDFDFVCDWKVLPKGNSGIMWHVSEELANPWETGPEMQILDDAGHGDGVAPETSAGACYALYAAPKGAVKPAGEWNTARIRVQGPRVELWLNGVQTASFDTSSADWKARVAASKFKSMPQFGTKETGLIALQDHGDEVSFRNIKVLELK